MKDIVVEVIMENFGVAEDAIKDDTTLADLGADDLDSIELCMALEDEFCIVIPEEDWPQLGDQYKFTVKQIRELVNRKLEEKKAK